MDFYDQSNPLQYDDQLIQEKLGIAPYWRPPVKNVSELSGLEQRLKDAEYTRELELRDLRDRRILSELRALKQIQNERDSKNSKECSCSRCKKRHEQYEKYEAVSPLNEVLTSKTFMFIAVVFLAFCFVQYMWQQQISTSVDELRAMLRSAQPQSLSPAQEYSQPVSVSTPTMIPTNPPETSTAPAPSLPPID